MNEIDEICFNIRVLLEEAVKRNICEGILLSGGLDTSILAVLASKFTPLTAFTVGFGLAEAPDVEYAKIVSSKLRLNHVVYYFGESEIYGAIRRVIEIVKSFDPMEIRNSAAIYIGLRVAREHGVNAVMTGDGADELFAGYSFLFGLEKGRLDLELQKLWSEMRFSSILLARTLGLEAKLPFLDKNFMSFAMKIDSKYKVRSERGKIYGKWILRKAFEGILPDEIVWRDKVPIEQGSGTALLQSLFNSRISDDEFEAKKREYFEKDDVIIRDKEQMFYYEVYRSILGAPRSTEASGKLCPYCKSSVNEKSTYCRTCGAYPI